MREDNIRLFGTDGIRGKANAYPMTPETAVRAGRAAVHFFRRHGRTDRPKIVVGRDTRISGPMLAAAVMAGICSMGGEAVDAGIIPTPGVAYLAARLDTAAGIVISASHNPYQDNGIKLFRGDGYKLSDEEEAALEALILDDDFQRTADAVLNTGHIQPMSDAARQYRHFLQQTFSLPSDCKMVKLVVDCSHGAASAIAPALFESLGFAVTALFNHPDGTNINAGCGSQHPEKMAEVVSKEEADLGLAFDGDGDRLIAVDERGRILSGDQLLAIFAIHLSENNRLKNETLVSTVMSNIGLGIALKKGGIKHIICDVGDRYVVNAMLANSAVLGGENSGHIIFHDCHTTGDGMLAALRLLEVILSTGKSLSELAGVMTVFPQVLLNVPVQSKPDLYNIPKIKEIIDNIEKELNSRGRVLVRYSGTQSLCRVMVEASTDEGADRYAQRIACVVREELG
ncbi:MAG: phosphoglucosamine mutase [Deltaproteobacteria bacterium]|nr:phosphoglucosamine mutase [Deltaproteobacteria bacterium]